MKTLSLVALFAMFVVSGCDSVEPSPFEAESFDFSDDLGVLGKGQSIAVESITCGSGTLVSTISWKPGGVTDVLYVRANVNNADTLQAIQISPSLSIKSVTAFHTPVGTTTSFEIVEVTVEFRDGAKTKTYTAADGQINNNVFLGPSCG